MEPGQPERDPLTAEVIGAAIEVHRHLGPGLLESVYHKCLIHELELRGVPVRTRVSVPITYKGLVVENALLLDILVGDELILELKSVERLEPIFEAQLLTYMRLSGVRKGLLLNFNSRLMKDGIKRMVLRARRHEDHDGAVFSPSSSCLLSSTDFPAFLGAALWSL